MMDRLEDAMSQSEIYLDLMAHDINNMNQVALGYLQLAESKIDSGESLEKSSAALIRKPITALEESSNLINNIRKLQRAKTEEMLVKAIDICAVLSTLKDNYAHIPGREISLDLICPGYCNVLANDLITDLFSNLIWNAIKHSDQEKPLYIKLIVSSKVSDGKSYCEVAVEDNGPGIPDDLKEKLFSRFSRGKTKAKGSGLGLYLVRSLAENYRGTVRVEDRVPGDYSQGSRFVVLIPSLENI
jgi:signal transduction histidine kinase